MEADPSQAVHFEVLAVSIDGKRKDGTFEQSEGERVRGLEKPLAAISGPRLITHYYTHYTH